MHILSGLNLRVKSLISVYSLLAQKVETVTSSTPIATLITRLHAGADADAPLLADGLVQLMMSGARCKGFWSGEIIAPAGSHGIKEWRLIERFELEQQALSWKDCKDRHELLAELRRHVSDISDELFLGPEAGGSAATSIITEVKPGTEQAYFDWERKIQSAQARTPGYQGIFVQPPVPGRPNVWTKLLRFDSPAALTGWFESEERKRLVAEGRAYMESSKLEQLSSAFPGWFPLDSKSGRGPAKYKTAFMVVLGLFPCVVLQLWQFGPMQASWNPVFKTLMNLAVSVSFTTFVSIPLCVKWFSWWLIPAEGAPPSVHIKGLAIVLIILGLEVLVLWSLIKM